MRADDGKRGAWRAVTGVFRRNVGVFRRVAPCRVWSVSSPERGALDAGIQDAAGKVRRKCPFDGQGVQVVAGKGKRRAVHGVVHRKRG